jgi:hypothetical protein
MPRLTSKEDLIVARQYLGACYHLLDDKERAEAQFTMLLAIDPKHRLDPEMFSPALVEFFESVRVKTGMHLEPKDDQTTRPGNTTQQATGAKADLAPKPRSEGPPIALAFLPLGAGQFNNRQPIRGALFAAGEVGLFSTAIATFVMFNSLKLPEGDPRCTSDSACFKNQDDAKSARTLQTIYIATFWSGIALTVLGIVEALISHPGDYVPDGADTGTGKTPALELTGWGTKIRF